METKVVKRYLTVRKVQSGVIDEVRCFLSDDLHFQVVYREFHMSGGLDGDLAKETAELEVFSRSNNGSIQLYVVVDQSTNGYAANLSILYDALSIREHEKLLAFLDQYEFVSSHSSFRDRPAGHHAFGAYLDDFYNVPRTKPFSC